MRIGALAKLSGLTASRIRFYESAGLIRVVERQANGYREYPPEAVWVLGLITMAQKAGFSLEQIQRLLPAGEGSWQHEPLLEALKQKVAEIEAQQRDLAQSRAQLLTVIDSIESRPADLSCAENKKRVLDRLLELGSERDANSGR